MFVSIYWVILEQCVLSVFTIYYLSFSIEKLLGYDDHKNRKKLGDRVIFTCKLTSRLATEHINIFFGEKSSFAEGFTSTKSHLLTVFLQPRLQ